MYRLTNLTQNTTTTYKNRDLVYQALERENAKVKHQEAEAVLLVEELDKKNAELQTMIDERDARIKELDDSLQSVYKSYDSLKMAKMVEITDGDMESAQKRLSKLIRDVNRCITLLSENSIDNG